MLNATHLTHKPIDYLEAQAAQRALVGLRREGKIADLLWLLEHPPTITLGVSGGLHHLRVKEEDLSSRGIALTASERGGDITFHQPGQLVGYPIVDLGGPTERDLGLYLRRLEEGIMLFLARHGIEAGRVPGRTGVWIDGKPPRKIAAIGVRVKRWVASHGFALNVDNDLRGFDLIVPCGIRDAVVTSMAKELTRPLPPWEEICRGVHEAMEKALVRPLRLIVAEEGLTIDPGSRSSA